MTFEGFVDNVFHVLTDFVDKLILTTHFTALVAKNHIFVIHICNESCNIHHQMFWSSILSTSFALFINKLNISDEISTSSLMVRGLFAKSFSGFVVKVNFREELQFHR